MVEIHLERTIAAPVEQVFDWLADPAEYGRRSVGYQGWLHQGLVGAGGGAGAVRERGRHVVREEITAYDRPHGYLLPHRPLIPPFDHEGGTLRSPRPATGRMSTG